MKNDKKVAAEVGNIMKMFADPNAHTWDISGFAIDAMEHSEQMFKLRNWQSIAYLIGGTIVFAGCLKGFADMRALATIHCQNSILMGKFLEAFLPGD